MISNQVVALVDLIYDYLVGLENGRLTPFLTDWLPHPYITRSIAPATLPVPLLALYLWHNGDLTQKSRIF